MSRAVFLDRDGTLNVEKHYLYRREEFEWIPGAKEAIRIFNQLGYKVFVITNQSGIARGYYTEEDLWELHRWMDEELRQAGAKIDAYYYCPHHPTEGIGKYKIDCDCRKPKAGLFRQAVREHGITDLANSWVVGDRLRDIEPAEELGCRKALVRTGECLSNTSVVDKNAENLFFSDIEKFAVYLKSS